MTKFIVDQYSKDRGGWSKLLELHCLSCNEYLFMYQKDGPGPLKRSYLDRVLTPMLQQDDRGFIHCPKCHLTLGFYEPYVKENNRPAVSWVVEAVTFVETVVSDS